MIIWINGPYGVGKTTIAEKLWQKLNNAFIFDAEEVGNVIRENKPKLFWLDEFPEYPLWREMVYKLLSDLSKEYNGYIIVPMTVLNQKYINEIFEKLINDNIKIIHFILRADYEIIHDRIIARKEEEDCWCMKQIERCLSSINNLFGITIETGGKEVEMIVNQIYNALI